VWGIVLVCGGITLPIGFLIVKACPDTIAEEIAESAPMYGVTFPPGVVRVVVPLTVRGLATARIFLLITAWNESRYANLLSQDSGAQAAHVGMRNFLSFYSANYPQAFAATVMAIAPAIIAYAFSSNRVITGHDRRDPQVNFLTGGAVGSTVTEENLFLGKSPAASDYCARVREHTGAAGLAANREGIPWRKGMGRRRAPPERLWAGGQRARRRRRPSRTGRWTARAPG